MGLVFEGLFLGLTLAIMLGPIFITLTQISVEKGSKAGLTACLGEWMSDLLFIGGSFFFIKQLDSVVSDATFTHWMGLIGGFILIAFGAGSFFKKVSVSFEKQKHSANDYIGFWTKGFLINTVNPFSFVFWITVTSSYVIGRNITDGQAMIFFSSIMAVIVTADIIKVYLAKLLRDRLTNHHFEIFSKLAGAALVIFGVVLLVRTQGIL